MNIIKLTAFDRETKVYVNMSLVTHLFKPSTRKNTMIFFGDENIDVIETPEEIFKIMTTPLSVLK